MEKKLISKVLNIFVIDDSKWQLDLLKRILESKGYAVQTFSDGENLLTQLRDIKPHLIISDIKMPKMDGFELFEEIKNIPGAEDVPVMFVSSLSSDDVMNKIESNGAAGFMQKPIMEDQFMRLLRKIVIEL